MKRILVLMVFLLAALSLAGCNSSSSSSSSSDPTTQVRVLHASPDAPAVNILAGGSPVLEGVDYKDGSGYLTVPAGSLEVAVDGLLPGGATLTVIGPLDIDLEAGTQYTVVAFGEVTEIKPLLITVDRVTVGAGETRIQVLHAAPNAPEVDVYLLPPDTNTVPEGVAPVGTFEAEGVLGPVNVQAGSYQIIVTLADDADTIVFDSGTVDLPGGADLLVVAVQNTAAGDAPISLVVMDGEGSTEILDKNSPANVRVVHASADAPNVDVVANDVVTLVNDLAFPEFTAYLAPAPDTYNIKVGPTGNAVGNPVIEADLTLEAGQSYTVIAVGTLAEIEPLVLVDNRRRIATEARVRIVHASTLAGNVDIFVTDAAGTDLTTVDPVFSDVPFKAETGYVSLAAGTYFVTVTPVGEPETAAIGPVELELEAGGLYGAIARDPLPPETDLGLILLDDLAEPI